MTRLGQEQVDRLSSHLEDTEISDVVVVDVLRELDDLEHGAGQLPEDFRPYCQKSDEEIVDGEMMGTRFGNIYHDRCVPDLSVGPLPLGQWIAGAGEASR